MPHYRLGLSHISLSFSLDPSLPLSFLNLTGDAAPLVHPHYTGFFTTTGDSATLNFARSPIGAADWWFLVIIDRSQLLRLYDYVCVSISSHVPSESPNGSRAAYNRSPTGQQSGSLPFVSVHPAHQVLMTSTLSYVVSGSLSLAFSIHTQTFVSFKMLTTVLLAHAAFGLFVSAPAARYRSLHSISRKFHFGRFNHLSFNGAFCRNQDAALPESVPGIILKLSVLVHRGAYMRFCRAQTAMHATKSLLTITGARITGCISTKSIQFELLQIMKISIDGNKYS